MYIAYHIGMIMDGVWPKTVRKTEEALWSLLYILSGSMDGLNDFERVYSPKAT